VNRFTVFVKSLLVIVLATIGVGLRADPPTAARGAGGDAAVAKVLAAKVDLDVDSQLQDLAPMLEKRFGIPVRLDKNGLRRAHVDPGTRITVSFKQVSLGVALWQILRPLKLQHHVADGSVVIDDVGVPLDERRPRPLRPVMIGPQVVGRVLPMPQAGFAPAARVRTFNDDATVRGQLRLVLQLELKFIKHLCSPTAEQLDLLKQDGLKHIVGEELDHNDPEALRKAISDPRHAVESRMADLVRARLSPAQANRFDSEIKKRTANLRQVSARNLVVAIDQELSLTEWQREKITKELTDNWDDAWTMTVVLGSSSNSALIPAVPDELIVPYLDAAQRSLWDGLPKRGNMVLGVRTSAFLGMSPPAADDEE
jgi:hypothetical protein